MEKEYDNTDRGALFQPDGNHSIVARGPIDNNGMAQEVLVTKNTSKTGDVYRDVYLKMGTLFESDHKNERSPDLDGPYGDRKMFVRFKESNAGKKYMQVSLADKLNATENNVSNPQITDEDINKFEATKENILTDPDGKEVDPDDIPF